MNTRYALFTWQERKIKFFTIECLQYKCRLHKPLIAYQLVKLGYSENLQLSTHSSKHGDQAEF